MPPVHVYSGCIIIKESLRLDRLLLWLRPIFLVLTPHPVRNSTSRSQGVVVPRSTSTLKSLLSLSSSLLDLASMRFATLSGTALAVASTVVAKEKPKDQVKAKGKFESPPLLGSVGRTSRGSTHSTRFTAPRHSTARLGSLTRALSTELYDSGVMHQRNLDRKVAGWMAEAEAGLLDSSVYPRLNYTQCVNGKAEAIPGDPLHTFSCRNIDLYDFINHATLGSPNGWDEAGDGTLLTGSSSWGWTDPDSDREFIASGMYDGTAFLEILPEGRFLHLGFL